MNENKIYEQLKADEYAIFKDFWTLAENKKIESAVVDGRLLLWCQEAGVGCYPIHEDDAPYDESYFEKYQGYETIAGGESPINAFRREFVDETLKRDPNPQIIDVGIGCGAFVHAMTELQYEIYGTDVNPAGISWLSKRNQLWNDRRDRMPAYMTFWDSLEHILDYKPLLNKIGRGVFVTIPVIRDFQDLLTSKHLHTREHCHYFSEEGFVRMMTLNGFRPVRDSHEEVARGRESVATFYLIRDWSV